MNLHSIARSARLDQDVAAVKETLSGLVDDVRDLSDAPAGETLIALAEVLLEDLSDRKCALLCAGALLRLAQDGEQ